MAAANMLALLQGGGKTCRTLTCSVLPRPCMHARQGADDKMQVRTPSKGDGLVRSNCSSPTAATTLQQTSVAGCAANSQLAARRTISSARMHPCMPGMRRPMVASYRKRTPSTCGAGIGSQRVRCLQQRLRRESADWQAGFRNGQGCMVGGNPGLVGGSFAHTGGPDGQPSPHNPPGGGAAACRCRGRPPQGSRGGAWPAAPCRPPTAARSG